MKHHRKTWGRITLGLVLLGLLVFGLTSSVWAADIRGGDYIIIDADEVIDDDLFITANRVEVEGTVKGDLFITGREIVINGQVDGSLFITGQTLDINGNVKGSVYGAGYSATVGRGADIERNLYVTGNSLKTEKGSTVGRSVYATGYQVIIDGTVIDDANTTSAALEINGSVGGDVSAQVSEEGGAPPFMPNFPGSVPMVATGYRVGDNAEIGGVENIEVAGGVDVGASFSNYAWRVLRGRLGEFIALVIVGGLLLWLWPSLMQRASTEVQEKALPNTGRGCLITLIFPIALVIAMIILIIVALLFGFITFGQLTGDILRIGSVTLALLAVVFAFIFSTVTKAIVAFLGGRLVLTRVVKQIKPGWWLDFASLILGALIYEILRIIPFVGLIVSVIVILVGLGAIYVALRQMMRPSPPPPLPPPPTPPEVTPTPEATV
jgi:cytoskeletal protein CcmA (bactofilin family)